MPPKPKPGGKKDEAELIEVSELPRANPFLVYFLYNMLSQSHREEVESAIAQEEKYKVITRAEIIECGRRRDCVPDPAMSDEELTSAILAKSAAARMYELLAEAMKEKGEVFKKIKEETIHAYLAAQAPPEEDVKVDPKAKGGKPPPKGALKGKDEPPPVDIDIPIPYPKDTLDLIVLFTDYPATMEEFNDFASENYAINLAVEITEKPKKKEPVQVPEGEEPPEAPKEEEEEIEGEKEILDNTRAQNASWLKTMKYCSSVSNRDSPQRQCLSVSMEYTHEIDPESDINSVKSMKNLALEKVVEVGEKFMKYMGFRQSTKRNPLMRARGDAVMEQKDEAPKVEEEIKIEEEGSAIKGAAGKKETGKPPIDAPPPGPKYNTEAVQPFEKLGGVLSEDDVSPGEISQTYYYKNLESVGNEACGIVSLLSCGIEQIARDSQEHVLPQIGEEERYNKLFEDHEDIIKSDFQLMERDQPKFTKPHVHSNISSPYQIIFDQLDGARVKYFGQQLFNPNISLSKNELDLFSNMILPGIAREKMPPIPMKSEALRGAERSELRPFSKLPIPEFERAQILTRMEEMLRNDHEDQQSFQMKDHPMDLGNRIYEEKMNQEILSQVLANILMFEPDIVTEYYEKEDALLLALQFRNPPGRILRKQWKAPYIVMPDFENWMEHFMAEGETPPTNILSPEEAKMRLIDVDDHKVGHISEKIKFLYPSDNSVIRAASTTISNEKHARVRVLKDNLIFGIRERNPNFSEEESVAEAEFWLEFPNGTKLLSSMQETIKEGKGESIPDAPDAASRGSCTTMVFKTGLICKFVHTGDIVQMKAENSTITSEESPSLYLSSQSSNIMNTNTQQVPIGTQTTSRVLPKNVEYQRVITGKGTVIRYMQNGSIEALHANGNYSEFRNGLWVGTNNKGCRRGRKTKDDYEFVLDPIPCAHRTDPESLAKIMMRDDNVMTIRYVDGTLLTKHKEGTRIRTVATDLGEIITVEAEGFAPVRITTDRIKARTKSVIGRGSTDALIGSDDIMARSVDGRLVETFPPDRSVVRTFREKQELQEMEHYTYNTIQLIMRPDGAILKVKEDGEVVILSSDQRVRLTTMATTQGHDGTLDYFYELFGVPTERKSGVYTCDLAENKLWTADDEGNKFILLANGETQEWIAVSFNLENAESGEMIRPQSPEFHVNEFVEEQARFLPPPKSTLDPHLFIIRNDGTGSQLFTTDQMGHYFRNHTDCEDVKYTKTEELLGLPSSESHTFMEKVVSESEYSGEFSLLKEIPIPISVDAIQQTVVLHPEPSTTLYTYRNILKHSEFTPEKREQYEEDMIRFGEWKKLQKKAQGDFGIHDTRTIDEKCEEKDIQEKIYRMRRSKDTYETEEEFKDKRLNVDFNDCEDVDESEIEGDGNVPKDLSSMQGNFKGSRVLKRKAQIEKVEEMRAESKLEGSSLLENQDELDISPEHLGAQPLLNASSRATQQRTKRSMKTYQSETLSLLTSSSGFVPNYYRTKLGQKFADDNPREDPSEEVRRRMKEKHSSIASQEAIGVEEAEQHMSNLSKGRGEGTTGEGEKLTGFNEESMHASIAEQDKHNPIVALQPEDDKKRAEEQKLKQTRMSQQYELSHYKQGIVLMKQRDRQDMLAGEEYHVKKTKEFDVEGKPRLEKPKVGVLQRTLPDSELNEKYISLDAITDRRVKISSMAPRSYMKAPTVQTMRNQGQHQMISNALTKKQTFDELMIQNNAMVEYVLGDPLKRNILMMPGAARFGPVRAGGIYEFIITYKNEDQLPQRINLRQGSDPNIRVKNMNPGPIASGMTGKICVELKTQDDKTGKLKDEFQIVTKSEIYKIPVFANILNIEDYNNIEKESYKMHNRPAKNINVRERKIGKKVKMEDSMPSHLLEDTSTSEIRLPDFPDKPPEFDPNKSLGELLNPDKDKGSFQGSQRSSAHQ